VFTAITQSLVFASETAPAGEEASSSFLVSPNVGLMIWTLVTFFIALLVLKKFAFPAIQEFLDKRRGMIEESIDHANQTREEADQLLAEYRERLSEARKQADEIVERSRKASEQAQIDATAQARETRDELIAQTHREIEQETKRALQEIRREVADLTLLATEKVTRKVLNADDQKRLVEEALSEVDFSALAGSSTGSNGQG